MTAPNLRGWLAGFLRAPHFIEKYPYYAAILSRLEPVSDPSIKQMAVSFHNGRFYLHLNAEYFVANPQYVTGILLHEVHHVALGHLTHPKFREVSDDDAMDLAVEMSANEYIDEPLPDPIVWKPYERYGLRAGQSTLERYEILAALRRNGSDPVRSSLHTVDDHTPWQRSDAHAGGVEATRQLVEDAVLSAGRSPTGDPAGVPERRRKIAGRDPGRLLEELVGTLRAPEVAMDWQTALRMFVVRARAPVHTYSRPNRRFPERVGEVPGRSYSPRVIVRPQLLVAIDTSISMTSAELAEVSRQLAAMSDHARITIAECDTEITRVYPFTGRVENIAGRGGTDLRPVFAADFLRAQRPNGIVYFTDGEGPHPEITPAVPTLWVLTKPTAFGCAWGERVRMFRKAATPGKGAGVSRRAAR